MRVKSSATPEVFYDRKKKLLTVSFRQGKTAIYEDVPLEVWKELKASESKGSFIWNNIRGQYSWRYI